MIQRADELAAQSEVDSNKRFNQGVKNAAKTATSFALGAGGAAASARVLPFLSDLIPADLAMKGINKVAPQLGKILQAGSERGLNLEDGFNFLKEKYAESKESKEAKQKGNIIQQYSPELFQYLENTIAKGVSPIQASVEARKAKKEFNEAISKMEKDHKVSFDEIVSGIFGQEPKGKGGSILKKLLAQPENPQEQQAAQMAAEQVMSGGRPQPNQLSQMSAQDSGDMRQQAMQPGQGQQKLMSAIQQLRQLRGA